MKLSGIVLMCSMFASIGAQALTVDQVAQEATDKTMIRRACRNRDMFRNDRRIHNFDNFDECVDAMRDCRSKSHFCDNEELFNERGLFFRRFRNPFFCRQALDEFDDFDNKNMSVDEDLAEDVQ